jgi:hypothetical protein
MNERIARLRAYQSNIARYERLLRSGLRAVEIRFVEQRLSEERASLAMLQFMNQVRFVDRRRPSRRAALGFVIRKTRAQPTASLADADPGEKASQKAGRQEWYYLATASGPYQRQ